MKVSVIPAQITTVEDRIAANLSFTQLVLLSSPMFIAVLILFILPQFGRFSLYKLVLATVILAISSSLAIRVRGKIVLDHIKLRVAYITRPHVYVYAKGTYELIEKTKGAYSIYKKSDNHSTIKPHTLPTKGSRSSQKLLTDKQYRVVFNATAGGLDVKVSTS